MRIKPPNASHHIRHYRTANSLILICIAIFLGATRVEAVTHYWFRPPDPLQAGWWAYSEAENPDYFVKSGPWTCTPTGPSINNVGANKAVFWNSTNAYGVRQGTSAQNPLFFTPRAFMCAAIWNPDGGMLPDGGFDPEIVIHLLPGDYLTWPLCIGDWKNWGPIGSTDSNARYNRKRLTIQGEPSFGGPSTIKLDPAQATVFQNHTFFLGSLGPLSESRRSFTHLHRRRLQPEAFDSPRYERFDVRLQS